LIHSQDEVKGRPKVLVSSPKTCR